MYESFFRFHDRPFAAAPLVDSFFPAEGIEQARQTLIRLVERAEGPGLVVGPAGVGKSLLCRLLAEYFRHRFDVVMLSSTQIGTRKALLQSMLFEVGLPYRDLEEGELRLSLVDFLRPGNSSENGLLLLVDEAHLLSLRLLEDIRLITNLVRDGQPRVHLVLAGGSKLEERFAHPKLESFNQRLAARCYLEALGRDETARYIRAQIERAGGESDAVMLADSWEAVYRASGGVPRLINQVCDHALVLACAAGQRQLSAARVEEAWSDLQQLPGPWQETPEIASDDDSIIEFGSLDDADDDPATNAGGRATAGANEPEIPAAEPLPPTGTAETQSPAASQESSQNVATTESADETVIEPLLADASCQLVDWAVPETPTREEVDLQADAPLTEAIKDNFYEVYNALDELLSEPSLTRVKDPTPVAVDQSADPSDNPFGVFAEEEIVVDQSTAKAFEAFQGRPEVVSRLGSEIAEALDARRTRGDDNAETEADESPATELATSAEPTTVSDHVSSKDAPECLPSEPPTSQPSEDAEASASTDMLLEDSDLAEQLESVHYHLYEAAASADVNLVGLLPEFSLDNSPESLDTPGDATEASAEQPDRSPPAVSPRAAAAESALPSSGTLPPIAKDCVAIPITRGLQGDDRDLIEIEGEVGGLDDRGRSGLDNEAVTRTLDYRDLFAQLRKA